MRVLIALGGNAMTGPDGSATPLAQRDAVGAAAPALAQVVAAGHQLVVTHGNGPQVGNLLVKNELAASVVPPVPLDWCGAQTQGTIGVLLLDALDAELAHLGLPQRCAALVSRTLVDGDDAGFAAPTKPVGRYLPADEAAVLMAHGQTWQDRGERGWRRVVASPEPVEVLDAPAAAALLDAGYVVVSCGGGGIPTVRTPQGLVGVEAVIDKDLTAAVLASALAVDVLVVATDVSHVVSGFGTSHAQPLTRTTPAQLRALAAQGEFGAGSMGPKVEAVCRFVESGRGRAAVTGLHTLTQTLADLAELQPQGSTATVVLPT